MDIVKIDNKNDYMDLLLEADPSEEMVNKYLSVSDMYGIKKDNKIVCVAVILGIDNETCELKNISTKEQYRGQKLASKMIEYLFNTYKDKYKYMIVGTSENMIPFYVLNGFTKYHKTIKNFFTDNYKEEIIDNGHKCIDMYYYKKEL